MTTHEHDLGTADIAGRTREVDQDETGEVEAVEAAPAPGDDRDLLFDDEDSRTFERRWTEVQGLFVDDPRAAVASADGLVAEVMQTMASRFADHKATLEDQWASGGDAETEDLRQAMHRYRAFFHRLLAA